MQQSAGKHSRIFQAIILSVVWVVLNCLSATASELAVEKYATGEVKAKYNADEQGQKVGSYVEYYESGAIKTKAVYRNNLLNGTVSSFGENKKLISRATYRLGKLYGEYVEHDETGKMIRKAHYVNGLLHGVEVKMDGRKVVSQSVWKSGELTLDGITRPEIRSRLEMIQKYKVPGATSEQMQAAVRRLLEYRFLCKVPYDRMVLNPDWNSEAEAAAKICEALGALTHHPKENPGVPADVYVLGKRGAARSNLYGGGNLVRSIDAYMNDSDSSNIDRVGHRRWCLNPSMQKLGLGSSGSYAAMWCMDKSRTVKGWQAVAFPPRGYMPVEYFRSNYAWSISLNDHNWIVPTAAELKVTIHPEPSPNAKDSVEFGGAPKSLELNYLGVNKDGMGTGPCVIFRPSNLQVAPGLRYRVSIFGIKTKTGRPQMISYVVEFMSGKAEPKVAFPVLQ